jgi:hypothetical protein
VREIEIDAVRFFHAFDCFRCDLNIFFEDLLVVFDSDGVDEYPIAFKRVPIFASFKNTKTENVSQWWSARGKDDLYPADPRPRRTGPEGRRRHMIETAANHGHAKEEAGDSGRTVCHTLSEQQ